MGGRNRTSSSPSRPKTTTATATPGDKNEGVNKGTISKMGYLPLALAVLSVGAAIAYNDVSHRDPAIPAQAQFIDQKAFNVLPSVPPPSEFNLTSVSIPVIPRNLLEI